MDPCYGNNICGYSWADDDEFDIQAFRVKAVEMGYEGGYAAAAATTPTAAPETTTVAAANAATDTQRASHEDACYGTNIRGFSWADDYEDEFDVEACRAKAAELGIDTKYSYGGSGEDSDDERGRGPTVEEEEALFQDSDDDVPQVGVPEPISVSGSGSVVLVADEDDDGYEDEDDGTSSGTMSATATISTSTSTTTTISASASTTTTLTPTTTATNIPPPLPSRIPIPIPIPTTFSPHLKLPYHPSCYFQTPYPYYIPPGFHPSTPYDLECGRCTGPPAHPQVFWEAGEAGYTRCWRAVRVMRGVKEGEMMMVAGSRLKFGENAEDGNNGEEIEIEGVEEAVEGGEEDEVAEALQEEEKVEEDGMSAVGHSTIEVTCADEMDGEPEAEDEASAPTMAEIETGEGISEGVQEGPEEKEGDTSAASHFPIEFTCVDELADQESDTEDVDSARAESEVETEEEIPDCGDTSAVDHYTIKFTWSDELADEESESEDENSLSTTPESSVSSLSILQWGDFKVEKRDSVHDETGKDEGYVFMEDENLRSVSPESSVIVSTDDEMEVVEAIHLDVARCGQHGKEDDNIEEKADSVLNSWEERNGIGNTVEQEVTAPLRKMRVVKNIAPVKGLRFGFPGEGPAVMGIGAGLASTPSSEEEAPGQELARRLNILYRIRQASRKHFQQSGSGVFRALAQLPD